MYRAITRDIQVTVTPKYLDERSSVEGHQYFWAYTVAIDNLGETNVQLKSRYWHITDQFGRVQEVRGVGVVGEQPVLQPGDVVRVHLRRAAADPDRGDGRALPDGDRERRDVLGRHPRLLAR